MQIFLSHSSKQKPLVREIKKHLPEHINAWIDEEKLIFGDVVPKALEETIKSDTDYVLLFIDNYAVTSKWVQKEIEWTLEAEKSSARTILLPIVLEPEAFEKITNVELQNRKYLKLQDFQESSVRSLSALITSELFALICRDMQHLRTPKPKSAKATIVDADTLIHSIASLIQKVVFPHRQGNPISKEKLIEVVQTYDQDIFGSVEFDSVLSKIVQYNLIPGLMYDGFELFLREEHASWKASHETANKQKIARRLAALVRTGSSLFLDAGSTIEEAVSIICKKIENRAINQISIGTTSVNIADMISDCCVKMGFDDEFCPVRLYVPGGQVRPNTQAITTLFPEDRRQVLKLGDQLGQFDMGVVGVNGVDIEVGFTTYDNLELLNKRDILAVSKRGIIVGDSSKLGIKLDSVFATFADDVTFITNEDSDNAILAKLIENFPNKIDLAR